MLRIDGTDGGGQMLRTALSFSVVTGEPFHIDHIRGGRSKPGLRPQHLTAVDLLSDLADADVEGAEIGAESLTFSPGTERRTSLSVDVGTAGSVTLLFDAILPVAATLPESVEVVATGGTDVKWAPTVDYLRRVKLPLLNRFGLEASLDLRKRGYYPAGGGQAKLSTSSSTLKPIRLERRGSLEGVDVFSTAASSLANQQVAERQAAQATASLDEARVPHGDPTVSYGETRSPGSSLLVRACYEESIAGFDALGERGKPAEDVADDAVDRFESFDAGAAPVDSFMADQVMTFVALAGGRVRIPRASQHVRTNLSVLSAFGSDISLEESADSSTEDEPVTLSASPLDTGRG